MTPTAAGFNQPAGPKPVPAPIAAPAPKESSMKTFEAKLSMVNFETRTFTLWTEEFKVSVSWTGQHFDTEMSKFKQWDKVKATYEIGNPNTLIDIVPEKKVWQGKGNYQPRNDKLIVLQSNFRTITDLFNQCTCPDTQSFDEACEVIYEKALAITARMMLDGAVK